MSILRLSGQIEFREQACGNNLFDYIEQLCIVGRVVSKDTERNLAARGIVMATPTPDIFERLVQYFTGVYSCIWGPSTDLNSVVDESKYDGGFNALQSYKIIDGLRERISFSRPADMRDEYRSVSLSVVNSSRDGVDGSSRN